jgi:hypothetical protein
MKRAIPALVGAACLGAAGLIVLASPPDAGDAKAAAQTKPKVPPPLDPFNVLAGEWINTDTPGVVASVFTVTSAGSVIREIMFPGAEHEMTNMYHLDAGKLVVTHYCAMGNQPRMQCDAPDKPGVYTFKFRDCTNMGDDQAYMGQLTLTIKDNDHISQKWTHFKGGTPDGSMVFELTRKK